MARLSADIRHVRQGISARASYPTSADSWPIDDTPREPIERCSPLRARLTYGSSEQQAAALMTRLAEEGFSLRVDRGRLRWRCAGVVDLALVRAMKRLEPELLGYVAREGQR